MKNCLLICLLIWSSSSFSQHLKKKYYGTYRGVVPAYKLDIGSDVVDVASASITITLTDGGIVQQLGNSTQNGQWTILSSEKSYYLIAVRLDGQLVEERLMLQKKTKAMVRQGIFPQPDTPLLKEN